MSFPGLGLRFRNLSAPLAGEKPPTTVEGGCESSRNLRPEAVLERNGRLGRQPAEEMSKPGQNVPLRMNAKLTYSLCQSVAFVMSVPAAPDRLRDRSLKNKPFSFLS